MCSIWEKKYRNILIGQFVVTLDSWLSNSELVANNILEQVPFFHLFSKTYFSFYKNLLHTVAILLLSDLNT